MVIDFSYRNLDASESLNEMGQEGLQKIARDWLNSPKGYFTFRKSSRDCYVEARIKSKEGVFIGKASADSFYSAIDLALAKLDRQIIKFRKKRKHHKNFSKSNMGHLSSLNESLEPHYLQSSSEDSEAA